MTGLQSYWEMDQIWERCRAWVDPGFSSVVLPNKGCPLVEHGSGSTCITFWHTHWTTYRVQFFLLGTKSWMCYMYMICIWYVPLHQLIFTALDKQSICEFTAHNKQAEIKTLTMQSLHTSSMMLLRSLALSPQGVFSSEWDLSPQYLMNTLHFNLSVTY